MSKFFALFSCVFVVLQLHGVSYFTVTDKGSGTALLPEREIVEGVWTSDTLECRIEAEHHGSLNGWKFTFSEAGDSYRLLAVKFREALDFKPEKLWDGHTEYAAGERAVIRDELMESFPMAAAFDREKGRAVSLSPESVVSTLTRTLDRQEIVLETRIVVDRKHPQTLSVMTSDFFPDFGWRNAVDDYYRAFSRFFEPAPGIDPRIYGIGGDHCSSHRTRLFQLHSSRQSGMDWEWTYAPWYESGNWYAVGKGWQGEKNPVRRYENVLDTTEVDRAEFDRFVRDEIHYGNMTTAMFFYILVKDIHQNLAIDYPDAVAGRSGMPSIPSNKGKTMSVFAPGSKIFDYLKAQIAEIVKHYEVSGFSFDMTNSSVVYRTPSQLNYGRGRSFDDENRIYTSDTILPIPFAEYIHTLKRDGKTMGVFMNMALSEFSPFTAFYADGIMMEGEPQMNLDMVLSLRLSAGRKPMIFWTGAFTGTANSAIKWHLIPPAERNVIYDAQAKITMLKCLELGCAFKNWGVGRIPREDLDILRTIAKAGYQVIPAVRNAGKLWIGRFGEGKDTVVTIGNPEREPVTAELRVVNHYLGGGKYGFIPESGTLEQKIVGGETFFTVTLDPHSFAVLRAVELTGEPAEFIACREGNMVTLRGNGISGFSCRSEDMRGSFGPEHGNFADGKAELLYRPVCDLPLDEKTVTAFMEEGVMPTVVASTKGKAHDAALMLSVYRPFIAASLKRFGKIQNREPGFLDGKMQKLELSIVTPDNIPEQGKRILIGTVADFPAFCPGELRPAGFVKLVEPDTLWIGGADETAVFKAAMTYFEALDRAQTTVSDANSSHPADVKNKK